MHKSATPTIVHFTPANSAPDPLGSGQAAPPEPAGTPGLDDAETSDSSGGTARGRKTCYSERIVDMMCGPIREFGLSDSAAAESVGMSSSTISRWKQQYPELGPKLQQAREQCRLHHLRLMKQHAEAESGKGWRASAWILERLFPGDYSPRMRERALWRQFEELRREHEEQQFRSEQIDERLRQQNEFAAQAQQAAAAAPAAPCEAASECAAHNSRNAGEAAPEPDPKPEALSSVERPEAQSSVEWPSDPERAKARAWLDAFERNSQNSRNSPDPEAPSLAPQDLSSVEGRAMSTAFEAASHNSRNAAPRAVLSGPMIPSAAIF